MKPGALVALAVASLVALIFLCLGWELWLAPLRPGGSWMALKALPLLAPLFGVLHGNRHTFKWATLIAFAYFVEGAMRGFSDTGASARLAILEATLALVFIASAVGYIRNTRPGATPAG